MADAPLVSVIIPVFNCAHYLGEAIQSVLTQTYRPLEVIVVDDGSTDGSPQVAQAFSAVRFYSQSHSGAAAARNLGVSLAQGAFIAFLDADDLWLADKLTRQMAAFDPQPGLDAVFGHIQQFHSPDLDERLKREICCPPEPMPGYLPSAMLVTRDAFYRVGPFETQYRVGEFINWYARAQEVQLRTLMLSDVVARRRLHGANQMIRRRADIGDYTGILKAALDRRRGRR
jgi:glycosyltransferase involved in cell wall biosynthesis